MWFTIGALSLVIVAQGVVRGSSQVTGVDDIELAFREFIRMYKNGYGSKEQYEIAKAAFMHSFREINDLKAHSVSKPHALRSLNGVVYREFQKGDDTSRVRKESTEPLCDLFLCWVAVPSGDKTVVGIVSMKIPMHNIPAGIETAIKNHRPKGSKDGTIGFISMVYVLKDWRRQKIASTLLSETFKELPTKYPDWGVIYLRVPRSNDPARELYSKAGFINILDTPEDFFCTYARYNMR